MASSSDEEDEPPSSEKGKSKIRKIVNAKSRPSFADHQDDDDDDDFFYDAEGRQHVHQDDSSNGDDSAVGDDPSSSSASSVNPAKSTPLDASSESHDDQGGMSESSDLVENVQQKVDEPPSSHRQTIENVEHSQNVSNSIDEDANHGPTNAAAKEQEEPEKLEDPIKDTAIVVDRQSFRQNDEDSTQSAVTVESPPNGSESDQVCKGESVGSDSCNGSEHDVLETMDDGSDADLKQTDSMSEKSEPSDGENHEDVQDRDSDDSAHLISTNPEDREEKKSIENQRGETGTYARNEIEQINKQEAEVIEKNPSSIDSNSDSINRDTDRCVGNEDIEPSKSDHEGGSHVDEDEDDDGFMIGSTTDGNEEEGHEDRTGDIINRSTETNPKDVDTTQSGTNVLEQSASPPEQSTGLSAAALAAIKAAQAQAEAMIELPNPSFPEKDAKKKKKKDKDGRKSKKEKKQKKSKNVDKDSD